jgi:hypothetical protein
MKKFLFILASLFIQIIGMTGCDKEEEKETAIHLGDTFTVKINESIRLTPVNPSEHNDNLFVHFKQVINDGRCLKSQCELCYGSRADVKISITENNETSDIELSILGCIDEEPEEGNAYKDTLGYRIHVLRLEPYPDGATINPLDYKTKLKITKL